MECKVNETIYSLVGVSDTVNSILEKVVEPLRVLEYGKSSKAMKEGDTPPPKFIMLTGNIGCGKGAVASALVNELRRGPGRKTCDTYYSHRKVTYLGWDRTSWDIDLVERVQNLFEEAKKSEGMTVLLIREFDSVCPTPREERDAQHANVRRAIRVRRTTLSGFISELCRQLDMISPGKILVIGSTSRPDMVHTEVLSRVEHTFKLSDPDEIQREEMLQNFLENENAVLVSKSWSASKFMEILVASTAPTAGDLFSAGDLQHIVKAAVTHAKGRIMFNGDWSVMPSPTPVDIKDFQRYIDLDLIDMEAVESAHVCQYFMPTSLVQDGDPMNTRNATPGHPLLEGIGLVRRIPPILEPEPVNENEGFEPLDDEDEHNWELLEEGEIEELLELDSRELDDLDDRLFGDDNHILD